MNFNTQKQVVLLKESHIWLLCTIQCRSMVVKNIANSMMSSEPDKYLLAKNLTQKKI